MINDKKADVLQSLNEHNLNLRPAPEKERIFIPYPDQEKYAIQLSEIIARLDNLEESFKLYKQQEHRDIMF